METFIREGGADCYDCGESASDGRMAEVVRFDISRRMWIKALVHDSRSDCPAVFRSLSDFDEKERLDREASRVESEREGLIEQRRRLEKRQHEAARSL